MPDFLAQILTSTQWPGSLAIGLAYATAVLGVFITFRILAFPDLTIDGSFPLGAAVAAVLLMRFEWSHWATLPVAALAGAAAGATTAMLAARLQVNGLLASILVALALNSINLRIMGQGLAGGPDTPRPPTANLPVAFDAPDVVHAVQEPFRQALVGWCLAPQSCFTSAAADRYAASLVFALLTMLLVLLLYWFLNTELGLAVRATGDNEQMVRAMGISPTAMNVLGLAISNGLIGLSGALYARYQGFADVTLGRGLIIIGLASVIIGEVLLAPRTLRRALLGAVVGAVVYRLLVTLALTRTRDIGLQESDLQLLTAMIVVIALAAPRLRRYIMPRRAL